MKRDLEDASKAIAGKASSPCVVVDRANLCPVW